MANAKLPSTIAVFAAVIIMGATVPASGAPGGGSASNGPGAVYAMTNDATNNEVIVFDRAADGTLGPGRPFATGGRGSGTFENSANGLILTEQSPNNLNGGHRFLFATNAGSDSVSVFRVRPDGLALLAEEPSGGDHPISVTFRRGLLYVLNGGATNCSGGTPTISGFTVGPHGELTPIPGSTLPVSGGSLSGCAQISFNKAGDVLIVTERESDTISTYTVDNNGVAAGPITNQTTGVGPFGFTFTQRGPAVDDREFRGRPPAGRARLVRGW